MLISESVGNVIFIGIPILLFFVFFYVLRYFGKMETKKALLVAFSMIVAGAIAFWIIIKEASKKIISY